MRLFASRSNIVCWMLSSVSRNFCLSRNMLNQLAPLSGTAEFDYLKCVGSIWCQDSSPLTERDLPLCCVLHVPVVTPFTLLFLLLNALTWFTHQQLKALLVSSLCLLQQYRCLLVGTGRPTGRSSALFTLNRFEAKHCYQHEEKMKMLAVTLRWSVPPLSLSLSHTNTHKYIYIYIYIQGVPGGMCQASEECSLCWSIPI